MITNKTKTDYVPDFVTGEILLFDKQMYKSSFDIVYKVRKATGVQKVGHAGTLDPRATGLIIICTGRKTKEINEFLNLEKTYTGTISLGKTTPSFDTESHFDSEVGVEGITDEMILKAKEKFTGVILQTPPMYSAIKKNGTALYHYARRGLEVERTSREINIYNFAITEIKLPDVTFEITCSKGTYIRVIAHEFGAELGCGAYLKDLRRTKVGEFNVEDAMMIQDFVENAKQITVTA